MTINQIRSTEHSEYPGMNDGYMTVTLQTTNTVTGENKIRIITVPCVELNR